jgi:aldehyde:ferredoxin oxidoreductase
MFYSLVGCEFAFFRQGIKLSTYSFWLKCVTGWDMDLERVMLPGEQIFNLKRLTNLRKGLRVRDDTLPRRTLVRHLDALQEIENVPDLLEGSIQECCVGRG